MVCNRLKAVNAKCRGSGASGASGHCRRPLRRPGVAFAVLSASERAASKFGWDSRRYTGGNDKLRPSLSAQPCLLRRSEDPDEAAWATVPTRATQSETE